MAVLGTIGTSWGAARHPVRARHAMVVSAHELATQVGVDILKKGGNAVDAAVATGFALAVVYPQAGNLGGGGFMVIRFPDGSATTIDYREKAPLKAHRDMYLDDRGEVIPNASTLGYRACGVPGSVAGLHLAWSRYGTLPWKELLEPAIRLAQEGFSVSYGFSRALEAVAEDFRKFPAAAQIFLKNGKPYEEGEIFVQKDLARTLKLIAEEGPGAFYRGEIADLIVQTMEKHGGLITREDLARYRAVERPPVRGTYRGYEVISMGPPSSGGLCLIGLLNIVEGFPLDSLGFHSSQAIHLMVEAMKRVYADRAQFMGDSDFYPVPVEGLLSKSYAEQRRREIDWTRATPSSEVRAGQPPGFESPQTTHYSIVDATGMAVAVTTTINSGFGAKFVIEGAGFLMNNEMDDFSIKPGVPNLYGLVGGEANAIAPEKRMLSSMTPTILTKDGQLFMVLGTPGGSTIITSVFQTIINVIDYGMNIQEAVDAPRFHHQWLPEWVVYEKYGLPRDVVENLERMGHRLEERRSTIGNVQAILVDPETGLLLGASDSRGWGKAMGY